MSRKEIIEYSGSTSEKQKLFDMSKTELSYYGIQIVDVLPGVKQYLGLKANKVYNDEFIAVLRNYQSSRGLIANGILDLATLEKIKLENPNVFGNRSFELNVSDRNSKGEIVNSSVKEISELEANLVADNIGVPKNQVFAEASRVIPLQGSIDNMRNQIMEFQKNQNLSVDGKIGKNTYAEILAFSFINNGRNKERIAQNGPSVSDQEFILNIFENGDLRSKSLLEISAILKSFEEINKQNPNFEARFGGFYSEFNSSTSRRLETPEYQKSLVTARKYEGTLYEKGRNIINDPNMNPGEKAVALAEMVVKDPLAMTTTAVLFLFGAFGTGTRVTDKWWKRLGIIIFGPTLARGFGLDKALKDLGEFAGEAGKGVSQAMDDTLGARTDAYHGTRKFIENIPSWVSQKIDQTIEFAKGAGKTVSDYTGKGLESINKSLGNMSQKNELYKSSADEKHKYIDNETFSLFSEKLVGDSGFVHKQLSDLEKAKGNSGKIKSLLSNETKGSLFPDGLSKEEIEKRNKDLVNYINLILEEKDSDAVFVSDVFVDNSLFSAEAEEYSDIPSEVSNWVKDLSPSIRNSIAWSAIFRGDAGNKNKLDDLISQLEVGSKDREILEKMRASILLKIIRNKFEEDIKDIDINGGKDSLQKLDKYYKIAIEKGKQNKNYIDVLNDEMKYFFLNDIENKYNSKKLEIIQSPRFSDYKEGEDYPKDKIEDLLKSNLKINEIAESIGEIPVYRSIEDYYKYVSDKERMLAFSEAKEIFDRYSVGVSDNTYENYGVKKDEKGVFKIYDYEKYNSVSKNKRLELNTLVLSSQVMKKYEELASYIKNINKKDLEELEKFIIEIEKIESLEEFNLRFEASYLERVKGLMDKFYPNEFPSDFTDFSSFTNSFLDYFNGKNKKSVYSEIETRLRAFNKDTNISAKVDENMSRLETVLNKRKNEYEEFREKQEEERKEKEIKVFEESFLKDKPEVFEAYKKFYKSLEKSNLKDKANDFPNPDKQEQIGDITIGAIKVYITSFENYLKKEYVDKNKTDSSLKEVYVNYKDFIQKVNIK
ncbi:hypothetical protein DLH72_02470 [Candidatus Gracilibacteria bacterium]|nr:MAG: hypothetical protein DLH72_02470 [Candidatus Gracilibacteria bacterium]